MLTKTFPAKTDALSDVLGFVDEMLQSYDCPMKIQMGICVAIEEVFVNIAHYAYPSGNGEALIEIETDNVTKSVKITIEDQGIPYDPLKKEDPDITLSSEERPIGGLGIYMVKKSMDEVSYEYTDGKNRLTIKKSI